MTDVRPPLTDAQMDRLARRRAGAKLGWSGGRAWHLYPLAGWGLGLATHGAAVWLVGPGAEWRERLIERHVNALARGRH